MESNKPEIGTSLDTNDVSQKMQAIIIKYEAQIKEIQPRTLNTDIIGNIEVIDPSKNNKKEKISKIADVVHRGTSSIVILAHDPFPKNLQRIRLALIKFNDTFDPKIEDKTNLIVVHIPRPSEEQLDSLRFAVNVRKDSCIADVQNRMKVGLNDVNKLKDHISKDSHFEYVQALNALVKVQQKVIESIAKRKLLEFD